MSTTRLLSWLTVLALLFAPVAMIGCSPAMAHVQPAATVHDGGTHQPAPIVPSKPVDCMVACAGCLAGQGGTLSVRPPLRPAVAQAPRAFLPRGLHPEAATPPPRSS